MGAPPDPESMIDMLSDPNMQASMNEALSNPQFIDMIIQQQPQLRNNPLARQMFQSPEFRRMMTDPASLRAAAEMQRAMGMGGAGGSPAFPAPGVTNNTQGAATGEGNPETPGQTNTTGSPPPINPFQMFGMPQPGAGTGAGTANPFAALFGPPPGAQPAGTPGAGTDGTRGAGTSPPPAGLPFQMPDPAALQQMLAAMGAGGAGENPFAGMGGLQQPQSPPDTRPLEERYENQLRQLNDMGFYDFDQNIAALRRTGGSVQGAIEYLLSQ
jgi:ubiquilin